MANEKYVVKEILAIPLIKGFDDYEIGRSLLTLLIGVLGLMGIILPTISLFNIANAFNSGYISTLSLSTFFVLWAIVVYASDILIKMSSLRKLREWVLNETR